MTKRDKRVGKPSAADCRREPVADAPNKTAPVRSGKRKPYVLVERVPTRWRDSGFWEFTHRYATPESRARARVQFERKAAASSWRRGSTFEEIDE